MEKLLLQVILNENEENFCAKCCKTKQVIERMLEAFPDFKEKLDIQYYDVSSELILKKYGDLTAPVVLLNDIIFSEGHVPIIKKLCREIITSLKTS